MFYARQINLLPLLSPWFAPLVDDPKSEETSSLFRSWSWLNSSPVLSNIVQLQTSGLRQAYVYAWSQGCPASHLCYDSAFPKLWVATQKWVATVAKVCQVGSQSFSGNIYFQSFICKLDKNTGFLLPRVTRWPGLPGTVPEWNKMSGVPARSTPGQCNVPEWMFLEKNA